MIPNPHDLQDLAFYHALGDNWSDPIAFAAGAQWTQAWLNAFVALGTWASDQGVKHRAKAKLGILTRPETSAEMQPFPKGRSTYGDSHSYGCQCSSCQYGEQ